MGLLIWGHLPLCPDVNTGYDQIHTPHTHHSCTTYHLQLSCYSIVGIIIVISINLLHMGGYRERFTNPSTSQFQPLLSNLYIHSIPANGRDWRPGLGSG